MIVITVTRKHHRLLAGGEKRTAVSHVKVLTYSFAPVITTTASRGLRPVNVNILYVIV